MVLNNECVNNDFKEEIKKYLETNENEHTTLQKSMGHSQSSSERKIHSITGPPQGTTKIQITNLNLQLIELEKL